MDDGGSRQVIVLVPPLEDAVRKVDIFSVHEELLVEQADLVQDAAAHPHIGTGQDLHRIGFVLGQVAQVVVVEAAGAGEEAGQTEGFGEGDPGGG